MRRVVQPILFGLLVLLVQPVSAQDLKDVLSPADLQDGWAVASAPAHAKASLSKLAGDLENDVLPNLHAVVVEHKGKLIYEQYLEAPDEKWGRPLGDVTYSADKVHDLRSISKSVTALLLGIALEGNFDEALGQPVLKFFPDWTNDADPQFGDITLEHVLTMTSGLEWNEMDVPYSRSHNDERQIYYNDNPVAHVLSRPMREAPGKRWYYNGGLTMLLAGAVARITGEPFTNYARRVLFEPLGIRTAPWMGPRRWPDGMPSATSGLRLSARDLARIGSLMLHQGRWQGRQIVPAEWIRLSSRRLREDLGEWGGKGSAISSRRLTSGTVNSARKGSWPPFPDCVWSGQRLTKHGPSSIA